MCSERDKEVSWEIYELYLSWAMWWGSWLEISIQNRTRRSRRAGGWKMEWKGTWGMIWGFPQEISVRPELGELEGYEVGKLNGPQLGYVLRVSVGTYELDPDSAI